MAEFSIRSDTVDVEQIMRQIRSRIREKRGVDYTEQEIHQLATAKLETFLDPARVRSDLLEQFRRVRTASQELPPPNFTFEDSTIFETHRGPLRFIRRLLRPILKLFFNPNPIAEALHIQADLNRRNAELLARRENVEALYYELIHNLVVEITRLGIEVRNMKMKVDAVAGRLDFDERRARALEGAVQYRPAAAQAKPQGAPQAQGRPETAGGDAAERRRRRRRRGRRRHGEGPAATASAATPSAEGETGAATQAAAEPAAESGHADTDADSFGPDEHS